MSVFNCNITYKKIVGDSYASTKNKLMSHGFIDKYNNVITDIATWREARSELNRQASEKLRQEGLNLYFEKKLLNGIRVVPDMRIFGMIDSYNRQASINTQNRLNTDAQERLINEQRNNLLEEIDYNTSSRNNIISDIYSSINQKEGSVINSNNINTAQTQIDNYNKLNTGKTLSLQPALGGYLIYTKYENNYLYNSQDVEMNIPEEKFPETDSNNNFNSPCL